MADFDAINAELEQYSPDLAGRPQIVAANKVDIMADPENLERLRAHVEAKGFALMEISAAAHQGTRELVGKVAEMLAALPPVTVYEPEYVPKPPVVDTSEPLDIQRLDDGHTWLIQGPRGSSGLWPTSILTIMRAVCGSTRRSGSPACTGSWRSGAFRTAIPFLWTATNLNIRSDSKSAGRNAVPLSAAGRTHPGSPAEIEDPLLRIFSQQGIFSLMGNSLSANDFSCTPERGIPGQSTPRKRARKSRVSCC